MPDAVLWTGILMLAGSAAAMAARALRAPAAVGALLGGFVLTAVVRGAGVTSFPDLRMVYSPLLAFLCFHLGAEIDLGRIVRTGRSILMTALVQGIAVAGLVCGAGLFLGLDLKTSLLLGAALTPACPAALAAVSSELRARGDLVQRLMATSSVGLLMAMGLFWAAGTHRFYPWDTPVDLAAGAVFGLAILMPLSRMTSRGAIAACAGGGSLLLSVFVARPGPAAEDLAMMAILAGFMTGNLTPNRDLIRDVFRDLALPVTVALFAISGAYVDSPGLSGAALPGLLLVGARVSGLALAGLLVRGRVEGLRQALAQVPFAGEISLGPVLYLSLQMVPGASVSPMIPMAASFVAAALGMIGTRWAIATSGEATALSDDPAAWRARMR